MEISQKLLRSAVFKHTSELTSTSSTDPGKRVGRSVYSSTDEAMSVELILRLRTHHP